MILPDPHLRLLDLVFQGLALVRDNLLLKLFSSVDDGLPEHLMFLHLVLPLSLTLVLDQLEMPHLVLNRAHLLKVFVQFLPPNDILLSESLLDLHLIQLSQFSRPQCPLFLYC